MRILVADQLSERIEHFELNMFGHRDDVDYLDLRVGSPKKPIVTPTPWPEVARRIRQGVYGAAFIAKPVRPWNPRKALWRNVWRLARHCAHGAGSFRLGPLLSMLSAAKVPIAGVDKSDTPVIDNCRFPILGASRVFFKRELPTNPANSFLYTTDRTEETGNIMRIPFFKAGVAKLRPLSLGVEDSLFARLSMYNPAKDIDVFFAGSTTNRPTRALGLQKIRDLSADGFRIMAPESRLSVGEYREMASRSRVCWSPEGTGFDCYRTYEVAALGSVPLLKIPPTIPHAPFRADVNSLFYTHESIDLYDVLKARLSNSAKLAEMGQCAREHVFAHQRYSVLAEYMLKTLLDAAAA